MNFRSPAHPQDLSQPGSLPVEEPGLTPAHVPDCHETAASFAQGFLALDLNRDDARDKRIAYARYAAGFGCLKPSIKRSAATDVIEDFVSTLNLARAMDPAKTLVQRGLEAGYRTRAELRKQSVEGGDCPVSRARTQVIIGRAANGAFPRAFR